ncbi:MAG: hypothetical protein LBS44_02350 [Deltaproteobacteria bacterium]|jgi:cell division protein FtsZ|nr:hypothetical protein [Deltaproteobacteria bacterium]
MTEPDLLQKSQPILRAVKVIGFGGFGCKAISNLVKEELKAVELIAADTDSQSLSTCQAPEKIQLGQKCCGGLGAGRQSDKGWAACEESLDEIFEHLNEAIAVVFVVALGGGTGYGAIKCVFEHLDKIKGSPEITLVVVLPFGHERGRVTLAESLLPFLSGRSKNMVVVSNALIAKTYPTDNLREIKDRADKIVLSAVKSIIDECHR